MHTFISRLRIDVEWRIALFTGLLLPLLVFLGFWQLQRADEKTQIAQTYEARSQLPAAAFSPEMSQLPDDALRYLPVNLQGTYLPGRDILLDNRIHQGRFGYQVVSPFRLAGSDDLVLVNRGWVEGDRSRRVLPEVPVEASTVLISGTIYIPPGEPYLLADQVYVDRWPLLLQALEIEKLAPVLAKTSAARLFPHVLKIDPEQAGALLVSWQVINVSPQKHQAYAVQWFAMAAALATLFVLGSTNLWQLIRGKEMQ
ncbi:MAG: cytochrome oxidase assembly protein ShyY1 [Alcanivorax sp.]|jgi:cytochrome oxidase assembly protein ShyY1